MNWIDPALLILFAIHLLAFGVVAIKRRTLYHSLLVLLFTLLTGSFALKIWAPTLMWDDYAAFQWMRWCAWAVAAVTLPWLALRIFKRTKSVDRTPS